MLWLDSLCSHVRMLTLGLIQKPLKSVEDFQLQLVNYRGVLWSFLVPANLEMSVGAEKGRSSVSYINSRKVKGTSFLVGFIF